ncbi:MAG: ImmA/IrrE family metallo-endopeptidase [Chromatiales bacterium]
MTRVAIKPEMLRWARQRARADEHQLAIRFPKLADWERGEILPTLKQLERYARATTTPVGYLFLTEPPEERIPIPDFRVMDNWQMPRPSPNLLETIYVCQQRQAWYQDCAKSHALPKLRFIGSATVDSSIEETAERIRQKLQFDLKSRRDCATWEEALREFIAQADNAGIMVMCSGVVQNNNHRRLDPEEFCGFAMTDPVAPLVFINGADSKSAQMFTLAHELVHLWLGQSAVSNADIASVRGRNVERWCNRVAAELLVPLETMRAEVDADEPLERTMSRLSRRFKVSTLVVMRRLFDMSVLSREAFSQAYRLELTRLKAIQKRSGGGNFYLSQAARVSKRFARALVESTLEGQTLYRDAMRMLGVSKVETFKELGRSLSFGI